MHTCLLQKTRGQPILCIKAQRIAKANYDQFFLVILVFYLWICRYEIFKLQVFWFILKVPFLL